MRGFSFRLANGWRNFNWRPRNDSRIHSAASSGPLPSKTLQTYLQRVKGFNGPLKAGLTSGVLSGLGDVLAQSLLGHVAKSSGETADPYDPLRTLRMFGFGFFWYGPYQFYWYNLLDWSMPLKTTANFLAKVTLNQLVLAPATLTAVFAWTLVWQGKFEQTLNKMERDLLPTMMNGWKFWVPAASLNFYAVPIQYQVFYMSCCGMLWTAYLSYASTTDISAPAVQSAQSSIQNDDKADRKVKH